MHVSTHDANEDFSIYFTINTTGTFFSHCYNLIKQIRLDSFILHHRNRLQKQAFILYAVVTLSATTTNPDLPTLHKNSDFFGKTLTEAVKPRLLNMPRSIPNPRPSRERVRSLTYTNTCFW